MIKASNTTRYRGASQGGFYGDGPRSSNGYDHIALVIEPEAGQFRAKFYLNGVLNALLV